MSEENSIQKVAEPGTRESIAEDLCRLGVEKGMVLTNQHECFEVIIDDPEIEDALEANIPLGAKSLGAAIEEYKDHISFRKK